VAVLASTDEPRQSERLQKQAQAGDSDINFDMDDNSSMGTVALLACAVSPTENARNSTPSSERHACKAEKCSDKDQQ
jgi:hypothetical protein